MFLENFSGEIRNHGWIEVICGSMFSGKTEELIRRLKRAEFANQKILLFKPKLDIRYSEKSVISHQGNAFESIPIENAKDIYNIVKDEYLIAIDEAQFFSTEIIDVCTQLAKKGKRVIVAGLDMDYLGNPFGPMPQLLCIAEYVSKMHAVCVSCGNLAHYSHRIVDQKDQVLLGALDSYTPLCRTCFNDRNP